MQSVFSRFDLFFLLVGLKLNTKTRTLKIINILFAIHYLAITYYLLIIKCIKYSQAKNSSDDTTYTFGYICPILVHHLFWFRRNKIKILLIDFENRINAENDQRPDWKLLKYVFSFVTASLFAAIISATYYEAIMLRDINRTYGMIDFYTLRNMGDESFKITPLLEAFVIYLRLLYIPWMIHGGSGISGSFFVPDCTQCINVSCMS